MPVGVREWHRWVKTSFDLPEDLINEVKRVADTQRRTPSALVTEGLIAVWIDADGRSQCTDSPTRRSTATAWCRVRQRDMAGVAGVAY